MRTAIIAAGLALVAGLGGVAPAEAQYYGHHEDRGGYRHDGGRGDFRGGSRDGYHGGYGHRYGYGYGSHGRGYHGGRYVCTYRHGFRRCFRRF